MALGEASVRILPDVSDFEKQLLSAVSSAMSAAQGAVDDAAAGISGAFDGAASEANAALASVTGDDFSGAVGAADAAAGEVAGAMDGAASEADAALSSVDGDGFSSASQAADQASTEIGQSFEQASTVASRALGDIDFSNLTKGVGSFAAVTMAVRGFINEAEQGQKAEARIRQIATSMGIFGDNVSVVTQRLSEYAVATARATGIDDDAIMMAQAKLLTFRQLAVTAGEAGGSFDRATQAALDLSTTFGSADSAALQLGKALQDPIKGMGALARSGVTFTAVEKERIRTLVESNQIGEAQRMVLEAIESQVGGTAEATATSSEKMRVAFALTQEELGNALLPAFQVVADAASTLLAGFNALPGALQDVVALTGVAGAGFYAASRTLQGLGVAAGVANKALGAIGLVLGAATTIYNVYTSRKREAEQVTLDLAQALTLEGAAQNEALAALAQNSEETRRFLDASKNLGVKIEEIGEYAKTGGGRLAEMAESTGRLVAEVEGTYPELAALSEEILGVSLAGDTYTEKARNMTQEQILAAAGVRDFFVELDRLRQGELDAAEAKQLVVDVTGKQTAVVNESTTAIENNTAAQQIGVEVTNAAREAIYQLLDATLSMFNSQLGLEDATFRTSDAVAEYTGLLWQQIAGTYEGDNAAQDLAQAQNNAASAALSQAASAAKLAEDQALASGATFTAADAARVQRDELQRVANSLDPNSPLRKQLQGYIDQLNNKIPKDIETRIRAVLKVTPIDSTTKRIMEGGIPYSPNTAEGGVFSSAQTRTIAEAGAEAVIPIGRPARAMELLELSGLADMVRGSGTGALVNIQQATFADATDADLVAQRLNTALRVRSFAG